GGSAGQTTMKWMVAAYTARALFDCVFRVPCVNLIRRADLVSRHDSRENSTCRRKMQKGEDMQPVNVLYVGDTEVVLNRYLVGADVIEQSYFNDNGRYFREAMASQPSVDVRHITPHGVASQFPNTLSELKGYDVVIFSDVGYNSLIFYPGLTPPYVYPLGPDRIGMVREFVEQGGGFLMVGGYLSFSGLNGIARWSGTAIETLLPVSIAPHDDRAEVVQGFRFEIVQPDHPTVAGLPWEDADWTLCGYNKVTLK